MKMFFQKSFKWAILFSTIMVISVSLILLDTFVIPRAGTPATTVALAADISKAASTTTNNTAVSSVTSNNTTTTTTAATKTTPVITSTSYKDENIQITIDTLRKYDTEIYIADIQISSIDYFKTAFANNTYGRNIKAVTSAIAKSNNAIFAINGDYYGFRDTGFVLRNGVLYRNTARKYGRSISERSVSDIVYFGY